MEEENITNKELLEAVKVGFKNVDERFSKVDERFSKMDERFNKIDRRFDKVDENFREINMKLHDLDEFGRGHRRRIEGLEKDVTEIQQTVGIEK